MKLTPPTQTVFWIALVLAVLGLLGSFISIPFVSTYAFWFALLGYVVLAAGNLVKGM